MNSKPNKINKNEEIKNKQIRKKIEKNIDSCIRLKIKNTINNKLNTNCKVIVLFIIEFLNFQ